MVMSKLKVLLAYIILILLKITDYLIWVFKLFVSTNNSKTQTHDISERG